MAIKLIIRGVHPASISKEYSLEDLVISVGRSQGCTVELDHGEVSRRHFVIKYEANSYFIIDEGSKHGTWLNDVRLEPARSYPLSNLQRVSIPGFVIEVISDNQMPRAEKTTVVARKLMGKIFEDLSMKEEVPFLLDTTSGFRFFFSDERSSFVLGRAHHLDFVVEDERINKEHLSFIRDINGVRVIIINDALLYIDDQVVKDSAILQHGAKLVLGASEFCFYEHEDEALVKEDTGKLAPIVEESQISAPPELPVSQPCEKAPAEQNPVRRLDQIFFALFCLVAFGVSWLWVNID